MPYDKITGTKKTSQAQKTLRHGQESAMRVQLV